MCHALYQQIILGTLNDKFETGAQCQRLQRLNLDLPTKGKIIQSVVWPAVFHGAEAQKIGATHFHKLRRAATDALIGCHWQSSSPVAMHDRTSTLIDPQL